MANPTSESGPKIKLPTYSIQRVLTLRDRLTDALFGFSRCTLAGEGLLSVFGAIRRQLPPTVKAYAVLGSLTPYLNRIFTDELAFEICWRLAGNLDRLVAGQEIGPWSGCREVVWSPVEFLRIDRAQTFKHEPGYRARLRVLAGPACPALLEKTWSVREFRYLASLLGFDRRRREHGSNLMYEDPTQTVGMRFWVAIEPPDPQRPMAIRFRRIHVHSTFRAWNRKLLASRKVKPCRAFGYEHACHRCVVGYDRCALACHPATYVSTLCHVCGNMQAIVDPDRPDACVACRH